MPDILPVRSKPFQSRLPRVHNPRSKSYKHFRRCLRWDAAFTCCFCLVHEQDVAIAHKIKPPGFWHVEHIWPQDDYKSLIDSYRNCAYSCSWCNLARAKHKNVGPKGERLLNPFQDVWDEHFALAGFELRPKTKHGAYTENIYDMNSPDKCEIRRERATVLSKAWSTLTKCRARLAELQDMGESATSSVHWEFAESLQQQIADAEDTLRLFVAEPPQHLQCSCKNVRFSLPAQLQSQTDPL